MNINDALLILDITKSPISTADIKAAYRKACSLYHPDRNPAGQEIMKLINQAHKALKGCSGDIAEKPEQTNRSVTMKPTRSQQRNMRAIEWLEQQGNISPTQAEIDEAERLLIVVKAAFTLTNSNEI